VTPVGIFNVGLASVIFTTTLVCIDSAAQQIGEPRESIAAPRVVLWEEKESVCSEVLLSRLRQVVEHGPNDDNLRTLQAEATRCSENAQYHALLSLALENRGDLANAAKEMNAAIKLDPHDPNFFFQLAQVLFKNDDLGGARVLLLRANHDFPDELWTYLFLATVYRDLGSLREAEEVLRGAATRWQQSSEVHILLGNVLSETGQHTRALTEFETALRINPKLAQAYLFYGIGLDNLNRTDDSISALKECVRLAPQMPNSHYYLGKVLLKKGEPTKAVQQLETAINLDGQYALAYFQLGKAYRQLGNSSRAEEYMQKYGALSELQKSEETERRQRFRDSLTSH